MDNDLLNDLLEAMPRIAEAVNRFDSPEVQSAAFDALMRATLGDEPRQARVPKGTHQTESGARPAPSESPQASPSASKRASTKKPGRKGRVASIPLDKSLNFKPSGKISLYDFIEKKNPKTLQEKTVVFVYWLKEVAECDKVGVGQIYTCYREMGWEAPSNPANQLSKIAKERKWLDSSDTSNVELNHAGTQFVEHQLPVESPK